MMDFETFKNSPTAQETATEMGITVEELFSRQPKPNDGDPVKAELDTPDQAQINIINRLLASVKQINLTDVCLELG